MGERASIEVMALFVARRDRREGPANIEQKLGRLLELTEQPTAVKVDWRKGLDAQGPAVEIAHRNLLAEAERVAALAEEAVLGEDWRPSVEAQSKGHPAVVCSVRPRNLREASM